MKQLYTNVLLWSVILLMFVAFYQFFNSNHGPTPSLCYSDLVASAQAGTVRAITFEGARYQGVLKTGAAFHGVGPRNPPADLLQQLTQHGARVEFQPSLLGWDRVWVVALLVAILLAAHLVRGWRRRRDDDAGDA